MLLLDSIVIGVEAVLLYALEVVAMLNGVAVGVDPSN